MTARRAKPSPQLSLFLAIEGGKPEPEPPDIDALFREFYAAYPRHVAVKAARKAFGTALKDATFDQLLGGAQRYAEECRRSGTRFVKHPATWLNGGCWADEPDRAAPSPALASAYRVGLEFRARAGVRR